VEHAPTKNMTAARRVQKEKAPVFGTPWSRSRTLAIVFFSLLNSRIAIRDRQHAKNAKNRLPNLLLCVRGKLVFWLLDIAESYSVAVIKDGGSLAGARSEKRRPGKQGARYREPVYRGRRTQGCRPGLFSVARKSGLVVWVSAGILRSDSQLANEGSRIAGH
jgi:hypothetical protein